MVVVWSVASRTMRHGMFWYPSNARRASLILTYPTIGLNEYDPQLGATVKIGLTDQQIADVVAYLQALK